MPLMLQHERLDELVCRLLASENAAAGHDELAASSFSASIKPKKHVKIAVVGKYIELQDAYKSIYESLTHAAASQDCGIDLVQVDAEELEEGVGEPVEGCRRHSGSRRLWRPRRRGKNPRDAVMPASTRCRSSASVLACRWRRSSLRATSADSISANSTEFDTKTPEPVIRLLEEQHDVTDKGAQHAARHVADEDSRRHARAKRFTASDEIRERHRHRYEFNMNYRERMEDKGFVISGTSPDGTLVELIELRDHPCFLACQFHPEFQCKPNKPHPLFEGFLKAVIAHQSDNAAALEAQAKPASSKARNPELVAR